MIERRTILSDDRVYRYTLWRDWSEQMKNGVFFTEDPHLDYYPGTRGTFVQFIGLNPSVADETQDDATIRVCRGFAQRWGFGAMCMTNLFAFRATEPKVLRKQDNPAGEDNTHHLLQCASKAGLVVAAWGTNGTLYNQGLCVRDQLYRIGIKLKCLRKTEDGHPCHPLRIPYSVKLIDL